MNKPKLAILSDIFGLTQEDWMEQYVSKLSVSFQVTKLDSRELAGIADLDQQEVHAAFVNGGIDAASENLVKRGEAFDVLIGFSVGGTIAWKYAFQNPHPQLHLVSATRIRNEASKPANRIALYFAEFEQNGPDQEWFTKLQLDPTIIRNLGHDCYRETPVIERICKSVLNNFNSKATFSKIHKS